MKDWAIILGGSSGMGLASAKKLAKEGMNLCIVHRDRRKENERFQQEVSQLQEQGIECITFNRDALRKEKRVEIIQQLKEKLEESGKVKLLLHSIARGNLKLLVPFTDHQSGALSSFREAFKTHNSLLQLSDFQATLEAMALSFYEWTYAIFEQKLFAEDALVLGLTSEGSSKAWPGYTAVSVAKSSLEALCRSIALEFAPYGIRCNLLQPGVTDTPSLRMIPGSEHLIDQALTRNPFHRLTRPEDVANVVFLLCKEEAKWINGAIIPVDGGERII